MQVFNPNDLDFYHVLTSDMDRARSLTCDILARNGEWDQLVSLRCDPSEYDEFDYEGFKLDYQITELLRKCADLPTTFDKKMAAVNAFYESEAQCRETNLRLSTLNHMCASGLRWNQTIPWFAVDFTNLVRDIIRDVLRGLPDDFKVKFSSGSTFDDRRFTLPQDKMSSRPTCTPGAWAILHTHWNDTLWCRGLKAEYPHRSLPKLILGNRFTTVPKDATKDRGICVEPSLNVTYQLGVGGAIRSRLRRVGIDLKLGQLQHSRRMPLASLTRDVATVDLSSASDSVSFELVRLLLPPDWFDLLDSLRSPYTKIDGKWWKNAKFSSMGCGFTFELETLIFYAISTAVAVTAGCDVNKISVYGDDIIHPASSAKELVAALAFYGFKVNQRKSFITDVPFRESCGSDAFNGKTIRKYNVKSIPRTPAEWLAIANGIRRMAEYDLHAFGDLYRYKRCWLRTCNHLPRAVSRLRGPAYLGDVVLHDKTWASNLVTRNGQKYIRTLQPSYGAESTTSYDRKFWTRDAIIGAAVLGALTGSGDSFVGERHVPGRQTLRNAEVQGYKVRLIPYFFAYPPADPDSLASTIVRIAG